MISRNGNGFFCAKKTAVCVGVPQFLYFPVYEKCPAMTQGICVSGGRDGFSRPDGS